LNILECDLVVYIIAFPLNLYRYSEANESKSKRSKPAQPWFAARPRVAHDFAARFVATAAAACAAAGLHTKAAELAMGLVEVGFCVSSWEE
jgi:putative hemolysin